MRKIIVMFAFLVATSLPVSAAPFFEDTFSPQQSGWSFQSPSPDFLGELNNNVNVASVTLTVTAPSDDPNAMLEFDLLGFRSLDGVNCCTDTLTLTINGTVALTGAFSHNPAINQILSNPSGATYTLLFVNTPGVGGANSGHRFAVPHHIFQGTNTYIWSYSGLQSFVDEAWGLDNVRVNTKQCSPSSISQAVTSQIFNNGRSMEIKFRPNSGLTTLDEMASACGYDHFNWLNIVTAHPRPALASLLPIFDPLPVDVLLPSPRWHDPYPFYWDEPPVPFNAINGFVVGNLRNTPDAYTFRFEDTPYDVTFAGPGSYIQFRTFLVGLRSVTDFDLLCFGSGCGLEWKSDNNGSPGTGVEYSTGNLDETFGGTGGIFDVRDFGIEELSFAERLLLATSGAANVPLTDHFLSYKINPTKSATEIFTPPSPVTLTEQSGFSIIFDVKKPLLLYTPANKNDEGVLDENTHLEAYSLKLTKTNPPQPKLTGRKNVHLQNQFGELFVDVGKPDRLLVPTAKNLTEPADPPGPNTVDHYRCDTVKTIKGTKFIPILGVSIDDQFIDDPGKKFNLKQLSRLCTPVKKNEEAPINNPDTFLLCYKAMIAKKEPNHDPQKGVYLHNQFGQEQIDTVSEAEFCVPTTEIESGT